jgi:hypothetical protein
MDKAGVSHMGGIRRWIARQIAKAPGEWARSQIIDQFINFASGHHLLGLALTVMSTLISIVVGVWVWILATFRHDPAIAVIFGLLAFLCVLLTIIIMVWATLWITSKLKRAITITPQLGADAGATINAAAPSSPLSDISWDFERLNCGIGFLDVARSASKDQTVWVKAFRAQGHNNTGGPIKNVSGIVRSEIVVPEGTYGIPRDANFVLESDRFSPNTTLGMRQEEFLEQFGAFTFELNYNGGKYVRHFSRHDSEQCISNYIANFDLASPKPPPMVTKKDCATRGD